MSYTAHTEAVLQEMQAVIDRARIQDAARIRALRSALYIALMVALRDGVGDWDAEHKEWAYDLLHDCQPLAEANLGIPREDVAAEIRKLVEEETTA